MRRLFWWILSAAIAHTRGDFVLLDPEDFKPLFKDVKINATGPTDRGPVNEPAFAWAVENVPFFECSDPDITATYAFRWRSFYTHIIPTGYPANPWVISECYSPTIPGRCNWGAPTGAINAAAGHHIREGRWIRDAQYIDSYTRFWYGVSNGFANGSHAGPPSRAYSEWIAHAAWSRAEVTGNAGLFLESSSQHGPGHGHGHAAAGPTLLESMIAFFEQTEKNDRVDLINARAGLGSGYPRCYYKPDGMDAMEGSISGDGCRPSNNAMWYGNALAISKIAAATGNASLAAEWADRAAGIRTMYLDLLWNPELDFFAVYKDGSPSRRGQANDTNDLPFGFPNAVCGFPPGAALPAPPPPKVDPWRYRPYGCGPSWSWHNQYKYANDSFACNTTVAVRELLGLGPPWYFEVPPPDGDSKYLTSWAQLFDPEGFQAKWGPTTAERRHRCFNMSKATDECSWNGASWPYETARVLTGLSNLINNYPGQQAAGRAQYMQVLRQYAAAHTQSATPNASSPYIGENIEPDDGYWIARKIMYGEQPISHGGYAKKYNATPDRDRSVDYNHSTFADLIIEGLVGLRAAFGALWFVVNPLASDLAYFVLDNVAYHGHSVSVAWDSNGSRGYRGCPKGLCVWVDGEVRASSPTLAALNVSLLSAPSNSGDGRAPAQCTTLASTSFTGGDVGTCRPGGVAQRPNRTAGSITAGCCNCCKARDDCVGYTLYGGVCYLKDRSAQPTSCDGCTSGRIAPPRFDANCTVLPEMDIAPDGAGGELASFPVGEVGECCHGCGQLEGCKAWTVYEGTCYLKNTTGKTSPCAGCTSGRAPATAHPPPALPPKWPMAGMTFTGGRYCPNVTMGSPASQASFAHLNTTGTTWVSIVATQYQWNISSTEIFPLYDGGKIADATSHYYEFVTLTFDQVAAGITHAHDLGMKVLLKPHVDLLRDNKPLGRFWRGDIGGCPSSWSPPPAGVVPFTEREWDAWFESYATFFMPYATLAEEEGVEMLSLNCELYCPNRQATRWRNLTQQVRAVYSGQLTVSQINGHERELTWWDAVDVIGIDAYYRVPGDTVAEIVTSWAGPIALAKALHLQYNKPVVYTELGYCSGECSRSHRPSLADYTAHAMHYEAVFEAFREAGSWWLGAFWWNWDTDPGAFTADDCLTPQFKPAEDVLRKYYRASLPKPTPVGTALCIGEGKCTC